MVEAFSETVSVGPVDFLKKLDVCWFWRERLLKALGRRLPLLLEVLLVEDIVIALLGIKQLLDLEGCSRK
jgi:hypothetical protein